MDDDSRDRISRRAFGQLLGAAALSASLPTAAAAAEPNADCDEALTPSPLTTSDELCDLSAVELARHIRRKQVSAREVMTAHLARIERVNPRINAIVTVVADRAMADAAKSDEWQARGNALGPLHGLPTAHKDLVRTAGIRTTFGSPLFRDNVPTADDLIVRRVRAAGAITLGKTNTPEWGAGSNTFNAVFGATVNPYDHTKTVGGSSGGAAAALRCGMVPIAGGSDMGGSLRNPAAFNNVVGLRPSPGRVPDDDGSWLPLATLGPMARTVADVALFLSAMAGAHAPDPLMIAEDGARFRAPLGRSFKGVRVAWFTGLGGIPFEPEITRVVDANRQVFIDLGCIVEEAEPDFAGVDEAFPILRHLSYHANHARQAREHPTMYKDTIKWEIAEAERNTGADVARAAARQARLYAETARFFETYEYFVLPVTQVEPFDIKSEYPTTVNGVALPTYIDWMRSCWYVTLSACPAISVPAGFSARGLPVGLQIVGRHRGDWSVLQMAHAFEQATRHGARRPTLP
ncbi:MAG TPA: amidase [Gemmatimonadaceae bacterium]|nr:amidase [Gemmatimonadaceae bacterium]